MLIGCFNREDTWGFNSKGGIIPRTTLPSWIHRHETLKMVIKNNQTDPQQRGMCWNEIPEKHFTLDVDDSHRKIEHIHLKWQQLASNLNTYSRRSEVTHRNVFLVVRKCQKPAVLTSDLTVRKLQHKSKVFICLLLLLSGASPWSEASHKQLSWSWRACFRCTELVKSHQKKKDWLWCSRWNQFIHKNFFCI